MDLDVLKSYLVNLGFSVNQPELRKFDAALKEAALSVSSRTTGVISDVLKWQAALTGAFTGISGAVVGMADHVAMADQKYRLMGLRMFMTQEAARKLSIGMNALGASLEEIAWDPELNRNFLQLADLQDRLAQGLGPKFEDSMRGIRDMSQKFRELRIEMEYLSYGFIEKLFEKMGTSIGQVSDKLEKLIGWIADPANFNGLTDWLADQFVPILKDTWTILEAVGGGLKLLGTLFVDLVNIFAQDDSLTGSEATFGKIAGAIEHVVNWAGVFIHTIILAEESLTHFATAAVDEVQLVIAALKALFTGDWGSVSKLASRVTEELKEGIVDAGFSVAGAAITKFSPPKMLKGLVEASPDVKPFVDFMGQPEPGAAAGAASGPGAYGSADRNDIASNAREVALKVGAELHLDPKLIFEQLAFETGNFTNRGAKEMHNLAGINVPGGRGQDYREFGSFEEFGNYYADLIRRRYPQVAGSTTEEQFASALKHGTIGGWYDKRVAAETYAAGMERFGRQWDSPPEASGGQNVTVGDISISITQPGASAEDIQAHVTKGIAAAVAKQQRQMQRNQAQLGFAG